MIARLWVDRRIFPASDKKALLLIAKTIGLSMRPIPYWPTMTTSTILGTCHCRAISYTVSLPAEIAVPLEGVYDHSVDLRLAIGFHCTLHAFIPSKCFATKDGFAKLETYITSALRTLSFCTRCGTTLFFRDEAEKEAIAILAPTIDIPSSMVGLGLGNKNTSTVSLRDLIIPKRHIFLEETFRGGVSRYIEDRLPRFAQGMDGKLWEPKNQDSEEVEDKGLLKGGCYCGGIKFYISRANEKYKEDPILKEWVKPGRKFCASYCFCHSCRAVSGAPFWVWAFIPFKQIQFITDGEYLRTYDSFTDSSRSVTRRFCARCGCHVFFTSTSASGKMWDVAVATLDQRTCEEDNWFTWRYEPIDGCKEMQVDGYIDSWREGRMGFEELGREYHPEMVEEVTNGLRKNL